VIAHAHNGIDLFRAEPGQQIPADRFRVDWPRSLQLLPAEFGENYENGVLVGTAALNERSFLHSRELVRETALVPIHHPGQGLLPELAFAKVSETRQDSKFRAG
jgi:hypothetical protein